MNSKMTITITNKEQHSIMDEDNMLSAEEIQNLLKALSENDFDDDLQEQYHKDVEYVNNARLRKAYELVYNDIVKQSGVSLFIGKYDARNGKESFMHGISTVMEYIASKVSDKTYEEFSDLFLKNLIKSEKKAKKKLKKEKKKHDG